MHTREEIVDLIAKNEMKEVCQLITQRQIKVSPRDQNKLLLLVSRYNDAYDRSLEGTIAEAPYQVEVTQIKKALINLLLSNNTPNQDNPQSWYHTYIPAILFLLLGLSIIVFLANNFQSTDTNVTTENLDNTTNLTNQEIPSKNQTERSTNVSELIPQSMSNPKQTPIASSTNNPKSTETLIAPRGSDTEISSSTFDTSKQEFTIPKEAENLANLNLEVATNHGKDSIFLSSDDPLLLYVRLNQPCFVRVIYELTTGDRILLKDSQEIDAQLINKGVRIGNKPLFAHPPYGIEKLIVLAQTNRFQPLKTRSEGAFTYINSTVQKAVSESRGLAEGSLSAQSTLIIKTSE